MDGVTGASRIVGPPAVGERQTGNRQQQADAFEQAMQDPGGRDRDAADDAARSRAESALRRALQRQARNGRKQDGEAHHVEVVA